MPAQSWSFLVTALLLAATIGVALVAIVLVRRSYLDGPSDRPGGSGGDWYGTLAEYRNLRDKGVLSDAEYRKIRTLVEPRPADPAPGPDDVSRDDHG
ncbi:MAG: hypothetical protein FJ309_04800 [Planctomycetes bacterium]|nr:hypothetical protein [Planctomycetota bacterium]MBU6277016.1 hypothetical protein [Planctomycetota bacterium]